MAKQHKNTQARLQELVDLASNSNKSEVIAKLKSSLALKNNFVVAKAAEICAQGLHYDLIANLKSAYDHFLQRPIETDKTCAAKRAIARALYDLDCDDISFYIAGMKYRQYEPVWGGSVDTAVDIRCTCALGLASTRYPRVMIELIELLHDEEPQARIGAIKAMEMCHAYAAEVQIRNKILTGDKEPEVIGECFSSLMKIEPEGSVEFVSRYADDDSEIIREFALLTLGESRLEQALDVLIDRCEQVLALQSNLQRESTLLKAIALHRSARAYDYLLDLIKSNNTAAAMAALEALSIYSYHDDIVARIKKLIVAVSNKKITEVFKKLFENTKK